MRAASKTLIATQFVSSIVIVILVAHAGSYNRSYFGASPTALSILLLATAHLFLTFFMLVTALQVDKIYETPLICLHSILFFFLLLGTGVATIVESFAFESLIEKEMAVAGAVAVFSAFTAIIGCIFSYNIYENWKHF